MGSMKVWDGTAWQTVSAQGPAGADGSGGGGGGELVYTQITSPVQVTGTSAATATTVIAGAAFAYDGSPVIVEFFSPRCDNPATSGATLTLALKDGATSVGWLAVLGGTATLAAPVQASRRITPTAGSHTYSVVGWVTLDFGSVMAGNSTTSYSPAYLRITRA